MKDIQGVQRGKCNFDGCDCNEYRAPPPAEPSAASGSRLRCEYCDHTPAQHVKMIALGECKGCGKDNCEKYESEDPNSYTDCAYCDCPASQHAGAEKLRKPQSQQPAPSFMGAPASMMAGPQTSGGFQPRMDAYGQPAQTVQYGTCKFPGCPYPRRVEGTKVHDFCGRTCAKNYSQLQLQGGTASPYVIGGGGRPALVQSGRPSSSLGPGMSGGGVVSGGGGGGAPGTGYGQPSMSMGYGQSTGGSGQPTVGQGSSSAGFGGLQPAAPMAGGSGGGGVAKCKKCGIRPPNPGRSWCQSCFSNSS